MLQWLTYLAVAFILNDPLVKGDLTYLKFISLFDMDKWIHDL